MRPSGRYLAFGVRNILPVGLTLAPVLLLVHSALAFERPAPPQVLFGDLYADVELERIFADSKEFADATAKSPPTEISVRLSRSETEFARGAEALRRHAFRVAG